MADVIELRDGQKPRADEHYAVVFVSSKPPIEGASTSAHEFGQKFFADDNEHDVSLMVGRAKVWAAENNIARIYVERESR